MVVATVGSLGFALCIVLRGRVCVTCGSLVLFWVGAVLVVGLGAKVC